MKCNCEHEGNFPINIIQGDSYRRVYKFYDVDGNIIDNTNLATVYFTCARLNYSTSLIYSTDDEGWVLYFTSDTTKEFAYCKSDYDLTLYFTDRQISTQIYRSEFRVCEKKMFPVVEVSGEGEYVNVDDITTEVYTNIIVGNGGGIADHSILLNRNLPNQHPMSAITGLEEALDSKQPSGDYATTADVEDLANIVDDKADKTDIPTKVSELDNDSNFVNKDYVDNTDTSLQGQIDNLQSEKMPLMTVDVVPTEGSTNLVESGGVYNAIDGVQNDVDTINNKIPAQASSSNQLADKAFVNSTIQTATANFRGNWNHWSEVPTDSDMYPVDYAGSKIPTTNDYLVVGDASDYTLETLNGAWRFKYSGTWATNGKNGWHPEYLVNETPLTMAQLDALNSGVTAQKVADYDGHIADKSNPHDVTYQQLGGTNPSYTKTESDNKYALKDEGGMIVINYADLGIAPYTFAEVKALLENGQDVRVKTNSYMPHCTSYSDSVITFFDITSWDLGAGVYSITYIHLRNTNDKYKYTETEPLNPVVYTRIAPNYSDSADYAVGDYCTRYENIYRCTTSILGGEEWNSAHWTVVTVMGEVVNKQDKLIAGDNITIENNVISATGGGDSAFIIDYNNPVATDYENAVAKFTAGGVVRCKKDNIALEMTGYDATHCYFGGTVSAYLPAGYVIAVYAHIGTNGQNYFWYQYNSAVEAAGLYSEDIGNYFTSNNVMGQLQEIGAKLAAYPSEVWEGGSYGG